MNDSTKLLQLIDQLDKVKILCLGDVMLDKFVYGDVSRISPEAPVPIVNITKHENRLGGAANVALNLKSIGAQPILCSVIGNKENSIMYF